MHGPAPVVRWIVAILLLATGIVAGCGGGGSAPGGMAGPRTGSLTLRIDTGDSPGLRTQGEEVLLQTSPSTSTVLIALLDEKGQPVVPVTTVDLESSQGPQTVVISDIPVGTWLLVVETLDSQGNVLARFSQHVTIVAGQATGVQASLTPVASPSASPSPSPSASPVAFLAVTLRRSPDLAIVNLDDLSVSRFTDVANDDGGSPEVLFSTVHQVFYMLDSTGDSGNTLQVYDPSTMSNVATLTLDPLDSSASPIEIEMLPDQTKLFVSLRFGDSVVVVDPSTNTITNTIDLSLDDLFDPEGMALSPDGSRLYVACNNSNHDVAVIDTATETVVDVISAIPIGGGNRAPRDVAISPDGSEIWFASPKTNEIAIYDTATLTHQQTITVQGADSQSEPRGMAFTPDGTQVVVTLSASADLAIVNAATRTQVASIPLTTATTSGNPMHVAVDPTGQLAYVTHPINDLLLIVDLVNETVVNSVSFPGERPTGVTILPPGVPLPVVGP